MHQFTHASSVEVWVFLRTDRQVDGLSAQQHGSLEKSFSPRNKAALYSSGTAANTADTDGGFSSESAWTCTGTPSLWINPNQPADHSNWLFGDVFRQIEAELLTDARICLPPSSVLLMGNGGTLTRILRRKQESVQSSALRVDVGVYSQVYQIFPISQWGFPWFSATFFVNSFDLFNQNKPPAVRLY